jgi:hypothetical protein
LQIKSIHEAMSLMKFYYANSLLLKYVCYHRQFSSCIKFFIILCIFLSSQKVNIYIRS